MNGSLFLLVFVGGIVIVLKAAAETWLKEKKREQRRRFYRVDYLNSEVTYNMCCDVH